jgi:hypothetical protein
MSGNPLVRFDEGRVGRTSVSPSLLLYRLCRYGKLMLSASLFSLQEPYPCSSPFICGPTSLRFAKTNFIFPTFSTT